MFSNYLKMTIAVMKRRKFYTFISLFGISFTLMVLIVLASFFDHLLGPNYPEARRDRTIYIQMLEKKNSIKGWTNSSPMSFSYAQKYVKTLKTPEKVSIATTPNTINTYIGGKKLKIWFKHTDAEFWELTDFEFLEGKPYTQQEIDNNEYGIVINDGTRDNCFGKGASAVGKTMEVDNVTYRVIGVVRGCPITRMMVSSDIYLPYNTSKGNLKDPQESGSFMAHILARQASDIPAIQAEYADVVSKVVLEKTEDEYDVFKSEADTQLGLLTKVFEKGRSTFFTLIMLFAFLFMLLPAINLVNINISRMMERASEIGIRKAFGASKKTLTMQFIIENILLTIMGGALALVLSLGVLYFINHSGLITYADLHINWMVALLAFVVSLIFGLMSGVYPAWRMSKLQVAEALKGGE
jgi:putative ABC transport system permease protein